MKDNKVRYISGVIANEHKTNISLNKKETQDRHI